MCSRPPRSTLGHQLMRSSQGTAPRPAAGRCSGAGSVWHPSGYSCALRLAERTAQYRPTGKGTYMERLELVVVQM